MEHAWPAPPIIPGDWKILSLGDACAVLARFATVEMEAGLQTSASAVQYKAVRACRLFPDSKWLLLEALATFPDGAPALLTFFFGPGHRLVPVAWTSRLAAALLWNQIDPPPSDAHWLQYLRLSVNCTQGDEGRFAIVELQREVSERLAGGASPGPGVLNSIMAPSLEQATDGAVTIATTTAYGGSLFKARYRIDADGEVQMVEDEPIGPLPFRPEELSGAFRVFRQEKADAA